MYAIRSYYGDKGKLSALKQNYGNSVSLIACDLTEKEGINRIKEKLQEEAPVIQYLVNNAGTAKMASYKEFTMDEISNTIDLNCKAPVLITNLCIPYMERGSKILNIASAVITSYSIHYTKLYDLWI